MASYLVRAVSEVWDRVAYGAKTLRPGDKVWIGGLAGELVEVTGDKLVMKVGTVSLAKRVSDLRAGDAVRLALHGYGGAAPATEAKLGLFLLAEGDYEGARKRIEAARAGGADVAREQAILSRFGPRVCPTCKGTTTVACPDCGGKGAASIERRDCDVCKGKGGGPCGYCHVKGRVRCLNCNGTGRVLRGSLPCNECGGDGVARCVRCGGDGHLKCSKCKGTGALTTVTPCGKCRANRTIVCPDCGGKGTVVPAR
ncbi:MAG: hypothetical protein FJ290_20190 [Planctomycetes bacterium]|nr:hypothetical protein [Planctomycetota bacterium]